MQWSKRNGALPERVFIYRDGCGDGQIPFVKEHEVKIVKEAFMFVGKHLDTGRVYEPALAFIIVTKRVNVRYFKQTSDGKLSNPSPGTVVDSVITRPERYECSINILYKYISVSTGIWYRNVFVKAP